MISNPTIYRLMVLGSFAGHLSAASLSMATATVSPGGSVQASLSLQSQGAQITGIQFDLQYNDTALTISGAAGSAATAASKSVSANGKRFLIFGSSQTPLGDGVVVVFSIAAPTSAPAGSYPVTFSGVIATDVNANSVSLSAANGTVVVSGSPLACTYGLTPPAASYQISGGAGTFSVATQAGCPANALVEDQWIHLTSPTNVSGGGNISYSVDPNTGPAGRSSVVGVTNASGAVVGSYAITQAGGAESIAGLTFVSLSPCRLMETRQGQNTAGQTGSFGPPSLKAGETRTLNLAQSTACPYPIPATAKAYVVNVTLLPHVTGNTNRVTIYPADEVQPRYTTAEAPDGNIVATGAIVRAGADNGAISVNSTDDADILIDISGYFTDNRAVSNLVFYPLTPCRVVETRAAVRAAGPFGGPAMAAGQTRQFRFPDSPDCPVPQGAAAYSTTITVVPPGPLFYLTAWPAGITMPTVSSLNSFDGRVVPNSVIVPASADGSIQVFTPNATDFFIDINGYFAPDDGRTGLSYYPVTQCTAADSSDQLYSGAFGGPSYSGGVARSIQVPNSPFCASIPSTAKGYAVNVAANPHRNTLAFVTLYPTGTQQPTASMLNDFQQQVVINSGVVPAGSGGSLDVFSAGPADISLMISGYFFR